MRAAVVHQIGSPPVLADFDAPAEGDGIAVGHLLAASLNPLDTVIVNNKMPHRPVKPPFVAGYEAVVDLGPNGRAYVAGPPQPFGALAELVPAPDAIALPVPDNISPELAVTLGVAGLAAWLSLEHRGELRPGESVLILGGGTVGLIATQAAKLLGAAHVVVADISELALTRAGEHGADRTINLANLSDADIDEKLGDAAVDGYDVVLDLVWGNLINHAINHANMHARVVQTGNASGPSAPLQAAVFRNKHITIIGQSIFVAPDEVRKAAYAKLTEAGASKTIQVDYEATCLDAISQTWSRLAHGDPTKLVVVP